MKSAEEGFVKSRSKIESSPPAKENKCVMCGGDMTPDTTDDTATFHMPNGLEPKEKPVRVIITDGNNHTLYTQEYGYTDAKKELKLFWTNNVLMLSGEY